MEIKGIFNGRISVHGAAGGQLSVELDGAMCELGVGEALGFVAAGWLESTPEAERPELFQRMLAGFVTHALSAAGQAVSGSVETFDIGPRVSEGKPS